MRSISRRSFIKVSALASTSLLIPNFLKGFELGKTGGTGNKSLVIVQLSGGNDGLNTVVPYKNDTYYKLRPKLAIKEKEVLKLTDELGLNPAMTELRALYDNANLAVLNNVGYPNPDRSHFRSMDIWHTASGSDEYLTTGWLGRYLDSECEKCRMPYSAIDVDNVLTPAMKGETRSGIAVEDPQRFFLSSSEKYFMELSENAEISTTDDNLDYLYKTMIETTSSAEYVYRSSKIYKSKVDYPAGQFAKNLKTIAELIISNIETSVYYVTLSGFDTHVRQAGQQERLLSEFSAGIGAFTEDLKKNDRLKDVIVLTFSEFGRRVSENASGGTDHGTANNIFIIGDSLAKPGVYNETPDLNDLDSGDLKYRIDFRNVYSTLLNKWLGADDVKVLGRKFGYLNFI
jgi:uncharacterized protein (DUF1501 family)